MVLLYLHFLFIFLLIVKGPFEYDFIIESNLTFKITAAVEVNVLMFNDIQALWLQQFVQLVRRNLLAVPAIELQDVLDTDLLKEFLIEIALDDEAAEFALLQRLFEYVLFDGVDAD